MKKNLEKITLEKGKKFSCIYTEYIQDKKRWKKEEE